MQIITYTSNGKFAKAMAKAGLILPVGSAGYIYIYIQPAREPWTRRLNMTCEYWALAVAWAVRHSHVMLKWMAGAAISFRGF